MKNTNKRHKLGDHPRVLIEIFNGATTLFQKSKGVEIIIRNRDNWPTTYQIYSLNDEIRAV